GLTISQCNPANCKPSEPMMSRYSARCAAVISPSVAASVNGAISIPLYPALRIARQAAAKGHLSKASWQMEWRNSMNHQCTAKWGRLQPASRSYARMFELHSDGQAGGLSYLQGNR